MYNACAKIPKTYIAYMCKYPKCTMHVQKYLKCTMPMCAKIPKMYNAFMCNYPKCTMPSCAITQNVQCTCSIKVIATPEEHLT